MVGLGRTDRGLHRVEGLTMGFYVDRGRGDGSVESVEYGDGCEQCEYSPGAYYEHAPDCGDDEDGTPNLCSGTGAHFEDCNGQWLPCPGCSTVDVIR